MVYIFGVIIIVLMFFCLGLREDTPLGSPLGDSDSDADGYVVGNDPGDENPH